MSRTDLPRVLNIEVKTSRAGRLLLSARDLEGIGPDGRLAALLTDRMAHGPRWALVPCRLLSPRSFADAELDGLAEGGRLEEELNRGWSDWILDEGAWRRVLESGTAGAEERIRWCRREHPPRRNRTTGALREGRLHRALAEFRRAVDAAAEPGRGAQAEGLLHQLLLEEVLTEIGYEILANPVGVPDIRAALPGGGSRGGLRQRLEAWEPASEALRGLRGALLDLEPGDLEELREILGRR